jgi:hypothetical protein
MERSDVEPQPSGYAKMVWRALEVRRNVSGRAILASAATIDRGRYQTRWCRSTGNTPTKRPSPNRRPRRPSLLLRATALARNSRRGCDASLLRGGLRRGRDSFYPAAGASALIVLLVMTFP